MPRPKMPRWLRQFGRYLSRKWECATKECSYYKHYCAYGPAELTHVGYHHAEHHCIEAQKRLIDWYETHPHGENRPLESIAQAWEQRVRA